MNNYIILGLAIIFNAMANILMKMGMLRVDDNSNTTIQVPGFILITLGVWMLAR